MRARSVVIIVLLILALTLVAQNTQIVSFRLWFWDMTMSRVLLLAGSMGVGVIIGLLLGRPWKKQKASQHQTPPSPAPKKVSTIKPQDPKESS